MLGGDLPLSAHFHIVPASMPAFPLEMVYRWHKRAPKRRPETVIEMQASNSPKNFGVLAFLLDKEYSKSSYMRRVEPLAGEADMALGHISKESPHSEHLSLVAVAGCKGLYGFGRAEEPNCYSTSHKVDWSDNPVEIGYLNSVKYLLNMKCAAL
jgi:hypothetical protein